MNIQEQVDFLLGLGKRLDNWITPGDAEDIFIAGKPLYSNVLLEHFPIRARVVDLLMARWIRVKDFSDQTPVSLVLNPAQKHFSQERTGQDIILKSGKVGFTTFIGILGLLRCITRLNHTALLIAHEDKPADCARG